MFNCLKTQFSLNDETKTTNLNITAPHYNLYSAYFIYHQNTRFEAKADIMFLKLSLNILLHIAVMAMAFSSNCLVPYHYDLKLELESRYVLKGESNIEVLINCALRNITFDVSTHIDVLIVNLRSLKTSKIYTANYILLGYGTATANFDEQLGLHNNFEKGFYILNIKFENFIFKRYSLHFMRTYWYQHKQEGWMIAILNQEETARELFPCFDEPELSATFKISVKHDKRYRVLSNAPIRKYNITANGTIILTHFQTTSKISSNDVAILIYKVDDLHPIHVFNWNKTTIETWCTPYFAPYVKFGLYVATMITLRLENQWNISRNVSKLDYVAVPNFKNKIWRTSGLIIYNEADMIYNAKLHAPAHKFIMMQSIAYNIIYKWCGYLFDPLYLSHWWLSEGFILFFGAYIVDQALPDIRMMDLFVVQAQHESRFLTISGTTDTNNNFFSPIKGAVIWRMLQSVIPDYIFSTSISTYLKLYSSNLKTPDDLWNVMEKETKKYDTYDVNYLQNVKEMMDIWTTQKYCSVLKVTRDYLNDQVIISKEFEDKLGETPYFIPVTYTINTDINFNINLPNINDCLTKSRPTLKILLDKEVEWIIINIQQTGYYRVNYDKKNWRRLAHYLNSENYSNIHVLNRAQIIDDAFYMAINEKLDFSIFWELASYLWREKDYIAWYPMFQVFEYTSLIFAFSNNPEKPPDWLQDVLEKIRNLFLSIPEDTYDQTIPTNNDLDKSLKQSLSRIACIIGNSLCIKAAQRQLQLYLQDTRNIILPGWQKWTYCNGLKYANMSTWMPVWEEASRIYKERYDYKMLEGLLCSEDPQIIINYLNVYPLYFTYDFKVNKDETIEMIDETKEIARKFDILTANIFLSALSRHAKNVTKLKELLNSYNLMEFSHVSINAVIIVIINNAYSSEQLDEIYKFATTLHIPPLRLEHITSTINIRNRKIFNQLKFLYNLYQKPKVY